MLIGYARVSKADGSQSLDLQRVALLAEGVDAVHVYHDFASGVRDDRPGLDSCVRALRTGDVLVIWKLGCFRHQLLLPRPYLVLTKPLRLDIQCQRGASVKIGWKYLDD